MSSECVVDPSPSFVRRRVCLVCGRRRGDRVLDCVGPDCPVAFHVKCYPLELKSHHYIHFRCPYCSYKAATARVEEVKKKVISAKQRFAAAASGEGSVIDPVPPVAPSDFAAQRQDDPSAPGNGTRGPCLEKEMGDDAESSSLPKQSAKRARKAVLPNEKRRRLNWTEQEVEMLQEGVREFAEGNKNVQKNIEGSSVEGSPGHDD